MDMNIGIRVICSIYITTLLYLLHEITGFSVASVTVQYRRVMYALVAYRKYLSTIAFPLSIVIIFAVKGIESPVTHDCTNML